MRNLVANEASARRADAFVTVGSDRFWCELSSSPTLVPIPAGTKYILFSFPDANYAVKYGDVSVVASYPSVSGITTDIHDINPAQRYVPEDATYMSIIAREPHDGLVSFYS